MRIPSEWRPLRLSGDWFRGAFVVGDGAHAICQVKWFRPGRGRFSPEAWVRSRVRRVRRGRSEAPGAPVPRGGSCASWVCDDAEHRPAVYLAAGEQPIALEVVINVGLPAAVREVVLESMLASLSFPADTDSVSVAVFGSGFRAPAGYRQSEWSLKLGDIALGFRRGSTGDRLLLRQVYPATLAFSRRPLERWLGWYPFKEHRRIEVTGDREQVTVSHETGGELSGYRVTASRRIPWPLGRWRPLESLEVAVHDSVHDRIYIAQHDSRGVPDDSVVLDAIRAMTLLELSSDAC